MFCLLQKLSRDTRLSVEPTRHEQIDQVSQ